MATQTLRVPAAATTSLGVDEKARVIRGVIIAELGTFKSGRGTFDLRSLQAIVRLMKEQAGGIKCRWGHPDAPTAEVLTSFMGRMKNPRLDGDRVRADLHLSPVAFESLDGGLSKGEYLLRRAKLEPDSLNTSLELDCDQAYRLDRNGHPMLDASGQVLPPIWLPTLIVASDLVDDGDAVHGGLLARPRRQTPTQEAIRLRARWALGRARRRLEEMELRSLWLANKRAL